MKKVYTRADLISGDYNADSQGLNYSYENCDTQPSGKANNLLKWVRLCIMEYRGVIHVTWVAWVPLGWFIREESYMEEPDLDHPGLKKTTFHEFVFNFVEDTDHSKDMRNFTSPI